MSGELRACSLPADEQGDRAAEFRALAASALVARERDGGAVTLSFRDEPAVREAVEDLVRRERECCSFLDFSVGRNGDRVTLAIGAGPEDRAALDAFYELAG